MTDLFQTPEQLEFDPNRNYIEDLVGDGKKFKDLNALAYSKLEADRYVKTLEQGRDQLREDYLSLHEQYKTGPKLQEILDQFRAPQQQTPPIASTPADGNVNQPAIKPEDIDAMIAKRLQETEAAKTREINLRQVENKLRETWGTNYAQVLLQKVNELGLSKEWANETAQNYPTVLFKTLGVDQQTVEHFQAPPTSQRSDSFAPSVKTRDWDYYENLRKTQPKVYWDTKTQVQMHKDSQDPKFRTQSWHAS